MKHIILACGLLFTGIAAVNAQSNEPSKGFKPQEKHEVAEANKLNKKLGQQQLNAPYDKKDDGKKKRKKKCCSKGNGPVKKNTTI